MKKVICETCEGLIIKKCVYIHYVCKDLLILLDIFWANTGECYRFSGNITISNLCVKGSSGLFFAEMFAISIYFILQLCDTWLSLESHRANTFGVENRFFIIISDLMIKTLTQKTPDLHYHTQNISRSATKHAMWKRLNGDDSEVLTFILTCNISNHVSTKKSLALTEALFPHLWIETSVSASTD